MEWSVCSGSCSAPFRPPRFCNLICALYCMSQYLRNETTPRAASVCRKRMSLSILLSKLGRLDCVLRPVRGERRETPQDPRRISETSIVVPKSHSRALIGVWRIKPYPSRQTHRQTNKLPASQRCRLTYSHTGRSTMQIRGRGLVPNPQSGVTISAIR